MITTEFLITALIVVLIPGTGVIYTLSMGLVHGGRASIVAAVGCTIGIIPHLVASILGLATLLHMSAVTFQVIKFIGAFYLLYLAWSMWKDNGALNFNASGETKNSLSIATKGSLINILNPKLSLFFLAFLPQFIPAQSTTPFSDMLLLSSTFMLMTLVVFIAYGLFANSVRDYIVNSPKVMSITQKSFASVFALLGLKLAMTDQ